MAKENHLLQTPNSNSPKPMMRCYSYGELVIIHTYGYPSDTRETSTNHIHSNIINPKPVCL